MASVDCGDGTDFMAGDPYLEPYRDAVRNRFLAYKHWKAAIERDSGSLDAFSRSYQHCGMHVDEASGDLTYREWIPDVSEVCLVGDFNEWRVGATPMQHEDAHPGWWSVRVAGVHGKCVIADGTCVKVSFCTPHTRERVMRLPAWTRQTRQIRGQINLDAVFRSRFQYKFRHPRPEAPRTPVIYESHVGVATEDGHVGQWGEFIARLPYIRELGYNVVQLMAVVEHPYYASFGYHVTSLFAPAARFGPPEELMRLVDEAHALGLSVWVDLVHAHSAKNVEDGLNMYNGTDGMYFRSGPQGEHAVWNSRMFNYGNLEVLRMLLSNLRFWMDEYQFDGFRFDGVTAMLYWHRGLKELSADLSQYFEGVDHDALAYLQLANEMLHAAFPGRCTTVAEEVSCMPGLCMPVSIGGGGFDYRLAMGVPDMWELMVQKPDEEWDMGRIAFVLNDQRAGEKVVTYCESHDQCIVGSKTIAFWLMDKEMYTHMSWLSEPSLIIDRGVALHKMIRLATLAIGGQAYLNFMGNEFAHPEWLDFPRPGNNESSHYARRQWSLPNDHLLRYGPLAAFDRAMHAVQHKHQWLASLENYVSRKDEGDKVIVFERGGVLFVFGFHPTKSFTDYRVGCARPGRYRCVLCSDDKAFAGFGRVDAGADFFTSPTPQDGRPHSMLVYIPTRTALVFALADDA